MAIDGSSASSYGKFTLDVSVITKPTNDSCTTAAPITLTAGVGKVSGDTTAATDQSGALKCGGSTTFTGPDAFYSVDLKANQGYLISLSPKFSSYTYIFKKSSCGALANIETNCASKGLDGDFKYVSSNSTGAMVFKPMSSGTYIIGVDSSSTSTNGSYDLEVKEFTPPTNDTCKLAKKITLVGGKATFNDYKVGATNKLAKCGTTTLDATDLFYKFTPVVGKKYKITFKPGGSGGRFGVWDGAHNCVDSAVETACGTLGSVYVTNGSSDSLTITSTSGDIYFVADGISTGVYDVYNYTFEIEQL